MGYAMPDSHETRVHCRVFGRVQGVYFRVHTQRQAEALGLRGWVRNRRDGSVELVAEGEPASIETFLAWVHAGPDIARVDSVEVERMEPIGGDVSFVIRPSA